MLSASFGIAVGATSYMVLWLLEVQVEVLEGLKYTLKYWLEGLKYKVECLKA